MAFLLWNALGHFATQVTQMSVRAWRWIAIRERYEIKIRMDAFRSQIMNAPDFESMGASFFELIVIIFIVGALIGNVANATTGITIPHTGFTPNPNLTASPGAVPLTQLFPLVFIAVGLLGAFGFFKRHNA
jgi:hypothetical protein